mmetsp:Transcript_41717/g.116284  ORF Transcript_41717/g.116284 Transcript_41717/m.116284 type:complete len:181 (-) Transcript_41717:7-549(-)
MGCARCWCTGVLQAETEGQRFAGVMMPEGVEVAERGVASALEKDLRRCLEGASGQTTVRHAVLATLLGVHTGGLGPVAAARAPAGSIGMGTPDVGELSGTLHCTACPAYVCGATTSCCCCCSAPRGGSSSVGLGRPCVVTAALLVEADIIAAGGQWKGLWEVPQRHGATSAGVWGGRGAV